MYIPFFRIWKPSAGFRYFHSESESGMERLFKSCKNNYDIMKKLNSRDQSPYNYSLGLRYAGINLTKNINDFGFVKTQEFKSVMIMVEKSIDEFSIDELSSLVFFIRVLENKRIKNVISKEFEKAIISRAATKAEYTDNKRILIDLYLNLGILKRSFWNIEHKILELLRNPEGVLEMNDLKMILTGAYDSNRTSSRLLAIEAIKFLENFNISIKTSSELIPFISIIQKIDERFSIGYRVVNDILDILLERLEYFQINEIQNILNFYSHTNNFDRTLLYKSILCLEKILENNENIEKRILLDIAEDLGGISKNYPNITINHKVLEYLTDRWSSLIQAKSIAHMELCSLLISYSYTAREISNKFLKVIKEYFAESRDGIWTLMINRALTNLSKPNELHLDYESLKSNFCISSYNIKMASIEHIIKTNQYANNKILLSLLDSCINNILSKIENWNDLKQVLSLLKNKHADIVEYPEMEPIISKTLNCIKDNWSSNEKWFMIKYLLTIYKPDQDFNQKWNEFISSVSDDITIKDLNSGLLDELDKSKIKPMIELVSNINIQDYDVIAHLSSFNVKDIPDEFVIKFSKVLNKCDESLVDNYYFNATKWSLFTQIFSRGYGYLVADFVEKVNRNLEVQKKSIQKIMNLAGLLGSYRMLGQEFGGKILSKIDINSSQRNLHSYIAILCLIPNKQQELSSLLPTLFNIPDGYSIGLLHEKINAYLACPFTSPIENSFLKKIENKLSTCNSNEISSVLNMIESLNLNADHHSKFINDVIKIASKVLFYNINYFHLRNVYKALKVFDQIKFSDHELIGALKQKLISK